MPVYEPLLPVLCVCVRRLLAPQSEIVADLSGLFPCELVVGLNGRVWVKAKSTQQTLILANLLESCENMTSNQRQALVKRLDSAL